jgi:hypothetical protein
MSGIADGEIGGKWGGNAEGRMQKAECRMKSGLHTFFSALPPSAF